MKTAVFTIASMNYFAFVRTLMDSLEKTNPTWDRHVVVVDEIVKEFEEISRNFDLIPLDSLDIPEREKMFFRYTIMELNTAVKPYAIEALFTKYGYDRVVYIDPDICVYEKMQEVEDALDNGYNFVLTPHFTGIWEEDGKMPDEPAIMRAGVYNLGFIALNKAPNTMEMVKWWEGKLEKQCVVDIPQGIFVDQKWIDLVPGRYEDVYILRHEGYNVAYWNLAHRKVCKKNDKYFYNDYPLIFFHYSGLNPRKTDRLSKHSDRFFKDNLGETFELVQDYADRTLKNNFDSWAKFKYTYSKFDDGREINDLFRYAYRNVAEVEEICGANPFAKSEIFYSGGDGKIALFLKNYLWNTREDLKNAFPEGVESPAYLKWLQLGAPRDYNIVDDYFDALVGKPKPKNRMYIILTIKRYVPKSLWNFAVAIYQRLKKKPLEPSEDIKLKQGVNLIGYIRSEHGVGEACRLTAECLDKTNIEWSAYDFEINNISRQNDNSWDRNIRDDIKYDISIFNVNADQMSVAKENLPAHAWAGYNIGVWYWELPIFPEEWYGAFDYVDEIWAPTKFIKESLERTEKCKVVHMPPGIVREMPDKKYNRGYFGLPENTFLFLNMFDVYSFSGRKNPEATVKSFQEAFQPDNMEVGLVLKINNASLEDEIAYKLKELIGEYKNIYVIAETMSREMVNGLICACDVAISLHRSEGLGLLCEEAMFYGKPVIATGWSGNMDFMNEENSCMVEYEIVSVGEDMGPYKKWQKWAEPSVPCAVSYMQRLYQDKEYYERIAKNAERTIHEEFSPAKCGKRMEKRLKEIRKAL